MIVGLKKTKNNIYISSLLFVIAIFYAFPIIWMILQSLKAEQIATSIPPKIIFSPTTSNYIEIFTNPEFINSLKNSFLVSGISIPIVMLIGVPAAYALARFDFRGKEEIGFFILSTIVLPPIVFLVPLLKMFSWLNLVNTLGGLIITHLLLNLGFVFWVMRSFFINIPKSLEDAARLDGCNLAQTFFYIAIPSATSGLVTVTIISFIYSWNNLLFSLALTQPSNSTLPLYSATAFISYYSTNWAGLSAIGIVMAIPSLILLVVARKQLTRGFSLGVIGR